VLSLFARDTLVKSPQIAIVDPTACTGCLTCSYVCHYSAIEEKEFGKRQVAEIIPGKCQGCGACVATCKGKAISLAGFSDDEIYEEIVSCK
jgi:heterodisulfide reductase subunit A